jgi:hypothetical protein
LEQNRLERVVFCEDPITQQGDEIPTMYYTFENEENRAVHNIERAFAGWLLKHEYERIKKGSRNTKENFSKESNRLDLILVN